MSRPMEELRALRGHTRSVPWLDGRPALDVAIDEIDRLRAALDAAEAQLSAARFTALVWQDRAWNRATPGERLEWHAEGGPWVEGSHK